MYTYIFMTSVRVIPVSAVLSRVPYEWLYLQKWVTPPLFSGAPRRRRARAAPTRTPAARWRGGRRGNAKRVLQEPLADMADAQVGTRKAVTIAHFVGIGLYNTFRPL